MLICDCDCADVVGSIECCERIASVVEYLFVGAICVRMIAGLAGSGSPSKHSQKHCSQQVLIALNPFSTSAFT